VTRKNRLRAGQQGFGFWQEEIFIFSISLSNWILDPQAAKPMLTGVSLLGGKRQERKFSHSAKYIAKVKEYVEIYLQTPYV